MDNKKKKVVLVPHSHWDREWYFTYDTANVLLNNDISEALRIFNNQKWFLDGQWSLIDDYLGWNPDKLDEIKSLLKAGSISCGPLYTQPDVFNSQAETIFRNFEIGAKIAKNFGVKQLDTAYLPDTFGFSSNLPQIFRESSIKNFVFWRGLGKEDLDRSHSFLWQGIDGSTVKSFVMNDGYFSLGMYYPYNGSKYYPEKSDPKWFLEKLNQRIDGIQNKPSVVFLPLGGDQAPFMHGQNTIVDSINKLSGKYVFELASNFDNYFLMNRNKEDWPIVKGELRYPVSGKIHRTISSARYDIKKKFRTAEDKLYGQLEPLEVYYSMFDKSYDFENFKIANIIKPLLIAQTHDSLGACNVDTTNRLQIERLEKIEQSIDSQIDLLIKKLIQNNDITEESIVIFNPAPFENDLKFMATFYSSKFREINIDNQNVFVKTLSSSNVAFNSKKPLYKHEAIVLVKSLLPMNIFSFMAENSSQTQLTNKIFKNFEIKKESIHIFLRGADEFFVNLKVVRDKGDAYDSSPGEEITGEVKHQVLEGVYIDSQNAFYEIESKGDGWVFKWSLFVSPKEWKVKLGTNNKLENAKVSLVISKAKKINELKKMQTLAISNFVEKDIPENWENLYSEKPLNVDINNGLIEMDDLNVLTFGNNEFFKSDKSIEITLYRTYGFVTNENLETRPSPSGLNWLEPSPDAQLKKELSFDFVFTSQNGIETFNKNRFEPRLYYHQNVNFIANKMTKFVINDILERPKVPIKNSIELENKGVIFSSLRLDNGKVNIRVSNPIDKEIHWNKRPLKPYGISTISLKRAGN